MNRRPTVLLLLQSLLTCSAGSKRLCNLLLLLSCFSLQCTFAVQKPREAEKPLMRKVPNEIEESRIAGARHGCQCDTRHPKTCTNSARELVTSTDTLHSESLEFISMPSYNGLADVGTWNGGVPSHRQADEVATCLVNYLLQAKEPLVVLVENMYRNNFIKRMGTQKSVAFVMLAVNADAPMDLNTQNQLLKIPGLRAVYGTNMENTERKDFFFPIPMGITGVEDVIKFFQEVPASSLNTQGQLMRRFAKLAQSVVPDGTNLLKQSSSPTLYSDEQLRDLMFSYEQFVKQTHDEAPAWSKKIKKLYVPPLTQDNPIRKQLTELLKKEEYADLVHIADHNLKSYYRAADKTRMPHSQYVKEVAHFQAVLSPPGAGYDCYRTWEALMIGAVPLVLADSKFDQRLFDESGAVTIPAPNELTPEKLRKTLDELADPAAFKDKISVKRWQEMWVKHLS